MKYVAFIQHKMQKYNKKVDTESLNIDVSWISNWNSEENTFWFQKWSSKYCDFSTEMVPR